MKFNNELDIGMKSLTLIMRLLPVVLVMLYVTQHSRSLASRPKSLPNQEVSPVESPSPFSSHTLLAYSIFFIAGAASTSNLIKIGVL